MIDLEFTWLQMNDIGGSRGAVGIPPEGPDSFVLTSLGVDIAQEISVPCGKFWM